jgi:nucleoside-diphosphate-sugar epimerase
MSAESLDRAVAGCDTIFHCAYGNGGDESNRRAVTTTGTELLLEAAHRHGLRRVVHTSTFSVYGDPPSGDLDEHTPRTYTGSAYGDSKIDAEKLALSYCDKGLSVAVVQPTIVYGPCGSTWTVKPLEQLASGRVILVNGGAGLCNAVYVDDVVAGMLRAAVVDAAHGQAFLISGDRPVTWAEYFGRHAALVPSSGTVSMTAEEAIKFYESGQVRRGLLIDSLRVIRREVGRRESVLRDRLSPSRMGRLALMAAQAASVLPGPGARQASGPGDANGAPPVHPLLPAKIRMFASTARARIDKAAQLLGYRPAFDFDRGMDVTSAWARWSNLC